MRFYSIFRCIHMQIFHSRRVPKVVDGLDYTEIVPLWIGIPFLDAIIKKFVDILLSTFQKFHFLRCDLFFDLESITLKCNDFHSSSRNGSSGMFFLKSHYSWILHFNFTDSTICFPESMQRAGGFYILFVIFAYSFFFLLKMAVRKIAYEQQNYYLLENEMISLFVCIFLSLKLL